MAWVAIVTDDKSGNEMARYTLKDTDLVDCDHWAEVFCEACEVNLSQASGHIPTGCADFTVTVKDDAWRSGHNWNSQSYFYEREA